MRPVVFHLGDTPIHAFGLMVALGTVLGAWIAGGALRRAGIGRSAALRVTAAVLVGAWLGARALAVLRASGPAHVADVLGGGRLDSTGAVLLGGGVAWLAARRERLPALSVLDAFAPAAALGEVFARVGCHLAGDGHWGPSTTVPWGVRYVDAVAGWDPTAPAVHPTPLYEAIVCLLIFLTLRRLHGVAPGLVTASYLALIGVARVALAALRTDPPVAGDLLPGHLAGATALVTGAALYLLTRPDRSPRRRNP